MVKGTNFISALYHSKNVSLPVGVHLVVKLNYHTEPKIGKPKRKALFTKNLYCLLLLAQALQNSLRFRYILVDIWFVSTENITRHELDKHCTAE